MDNATLILLSKGAIILSSAFVISFVLRKSLNRIKRFNTENGIDNTKLIFIKNSLNFLVYTVAFILIMRTVPHFKDVGNSILAGAGILAAIVGFASQAAFSNIVSGVFIVLFKPFRVNDVIEFKDGFKGIVTEISFRHTIIKDFQNRRIIIPNTIISNETIINSSIEDAEIMKHIVFSIAYDANVDKAIHIIQEEIGKHPLCLDNRLPSEQNRDKVVVIMTAWESSSISLRANVWTKDSFAAFDLSCDSLYNVKKRFEAEGIEIPYPYQNVVIKRRT